MPACCCATWRLRAKKVVVLELAPAVAPMTVHRRLKKRVAASPPAIHWHIPSDHDTRVPVVCRDETNQQRVGEVRPPQPVPAGLYGVNTGTCSRGSLVFPSSGTVDQTVPRGDTSHAHPPGLGALDLGHAGHALS